MEAGPLWRLPLPDKCNVQSNKKQYSDPPDPDQTRPVPNPFLYPSQSLAPSVLVILGNADCECLMPLDFPL